MRLKSINHFDKRTCARARYFRVYFEFAKTCTQQTFGNVRKTKQFLRPRLQQADFF